MKKFEEFTKEMKMETEKAAKRRAAIKADKLAEMENLRDHYIPEIAQKMYYLYAGIAPVLPGSSFEYDNTLVIDSAFAEARITINNMQMTVCFKKSGDVTVEFRKGIDDIIMLSQQIGLLQTIDAYLKENIDDIMASALKWCKSLSSAAADTNISVDEEVQPVYYVAIAMSM